MASQGLARRVLVAGLALAAAGLAAAWWASEPRPSFPVGIVLLLAAATTTVLGGPRVGAIAGLAATAAVATRLLTGDQLAQLRFAEGAAIGTARWVEAGGLLVTVVAAVVVLVGQWRAGRSAGAGSRRRARAQAVQVAGLLVLSAIGAELLAAYDDSTGRPAELLFAVIFFAALYGAPALVIRELVRRNGWGWPSLIALAFALAILQPAVIDQSLFSTDYRDIESWNDSTFIGPLGFSATNALNFVLGHVIFSFCAPIAVAEAWRPQTARTPWLRNPGVTVAAIAYAVVAVMIMSDPESQSASVTQLVASVAVVALCVAVAVILGRRHTTQPSARRAPSLTVTLAASFVLFVVATAVQEGWVGVAFSIMVYAAGAALLGYVSRRPGWSIRHIAAVATGALLARGALAFLYFPVVGETSAARKYTHNVVMLILVALAGFLALRRERPRGQVTVVQRGETTQRVEAE